MRCLVLIATLFVAPSLATEHFNHGYYGGGLDYSKWNLNGGGHGVAPVSHVAAAPAAETHIAHGHVAAAPVAHVTKSVHKEVYAVKPVYEKHYDKEGALPQVSVKFHKQPVLAYGIHPKGRSTTFVLPPLLNPKISPIITLTNKFPKDW